jgi:hypothetical protein
MTATISPAATARSAPRSAGVCPKDRWTSCASTRSPPAPDGPPGAVGAHLRTSSTNAEPGRGGLDPPQVRLEPEHAVVGEEFVDQRSGALDLGQLPHPPDVSGALHVEVRARVASQHQRQHDLGEQLVLQVGFGLDRLGQPGLHLGGAEGGDDVPLGVRAGARLGRPDHDLSVAGAPAERGVRLPEQQRLAPAEVRVVVAPEVPAVARFAFEQSEERQGNRHNRVSTLSVYGWSDGGLCPVTSAGVVTRRASRRCTRAGAVRRSGSGLRGVLCPVAR